MGSFLYKDERSKLIIFLVGIVVIQGIVFSGITKMILSRMNERYINKSYDIVSVVSNNDKELVKKVIPIIVGKETVNNDVGRQILQKYSYDNNLSYKYNPLTENINYSKFIVISVIIISLIGIIGIFLILKPLFKDINYLKNRADEIVENRNKKEDRRQGTSRAGTLDKLFHKFNLMEDRIENNIVLLKDEKINLKNIINDISHQLKTPITALTMYNDILIDHKEMDSEDIDTFLISSKEQLERMEWLVLTLLKYARLESNVVKYNKEELDLNITIEEAIEPLKIKAEEKKQLLIYSGTESTVYNHDRNWLGEAISNIVKNAIEHTGIEGLVEVSLEETEIYDLIKIKDNGNGIEKSELKKIFKRFYKGESSTNPTSIGIGLCLSKIIVNNHNGDISVESEVGRGTTFYIKLLKTV
ncbi:MAG: sensor histidine kinase [Clostridium sp.]|uniref:sensor histidine kinase n=1 Tax=Clostridium sp. TaxID=1506 RepID=UPI003F3E3315